jgi:hypothetical protein
MSFGQSHVGQELTPPFSAPGHNIALRRTAYARDPFGPHNGRVGGDDYVSRALYRAGHRLVRSSDLAIYHEDISLSIRGLLERHLREQFAILVPGGYAPDGTRWLVLRRTLRSFVWKARTIHRWGPAVGVTAYDWLAVPPLLLCYALMDSIAVLGVCLVPRARRRLYGYLFGGLVT